MTGGGRIQITDRDGRSNDRTARVVDGRLLVQTQGGGGGPTSDVNIAEVGGTPVGGSSVPINDAGGSITVDGAVDVSGSAVTIQEPLSVDDNGGSLTVDDGGGSLTVDGTVGVNNFPASQTVDQATHDNLNANANLQVGDADVDSSNPVPVSIVDEGFTVEVLSNSTSGRPIQVTATTAGTANDLHTVPASFIDCITIYVTNPSTIDATIALQIGSAGAGDRVDSFCPAGETVVIFPAVAVEAGVLIEAWLPGGAAPTLNVFGKIERRAA